MNKTSSPAFWPQYDSLAFKLLRDMVEGGAVSIPFGTTADRVIQFNAAIMTLRSIGWPVVGQRGPASAISLQYLLPEHVADAAAQEIKRLAAAKQE